MRSQAQRRKLWATNPELARRFEDHTPKGRKLPERADRMQRALKRRGRRRRSDRRD
jgi:hypothetical protein